MWQILEAQTADRLHWFIVPGGSAAEAIERFKTELMVSGARLVDSDGKTVQANDLIRTSIRELSEHLKPRDEAVAAHYTVFGGSAAGYKLE